jgi:predicted AAA+ superfamily ATPase
LEKKPEWVIIDEIQKVPKLLDIVHHLIETKKYKFILTGSTARKLKRSSSNLLAGRAFLYHLFPLTHLELKDDFELNEILHWGSLPTIFSLPPKGRAEFLRAYTQVYLKEEILQEQIVRNGSAFRNFLEVAAL